jgi:hypothetical protein
MDRADIIHLERGHEGDWVGVTGGTASGERALAQAAPQRAWQAVCALWERLRVQWHRPIDFSGAWLSFGDAPELFEALVRMRKKTGGPLIHRVLLDHDFHISIHQQRRLGLPFGAVNCLTVGLPLLLMLDRSRFLALLAQQYGRLQAGDTGSRPLTHAWSADQTGSALPAKKVARARLREYRADRTARKLLGRQVAAAAMTEFAIKSDWMARQFWPDHWRTAAFNLTPAPPFSALRVLACKPPPDEFARESFRQAMIGAIDISEGHVSLGQRLDKLRVPRELPAWSSRQALSMLGRQGPRWIARFDREWCRANALEWKLHHAYLGRVRTHAQAVSQGNRRHSAEDVIELAQLAQRLDAGADVRPVYEHALSMAPGHPAALRGLIQCLPAAERDLRLHYARQLYEASESSRWWACCVAVSELQKPSAHGSIDEAELQHWREKLDQAEEVEALIRQKMADGPWYESIAHEDLTEFEKGELQARLGHSSGVARAWLVRKLLPGLEHRRCYLLLLELQGLSDDKRAFSCRALQRSLELPGPVLVLTAGRGRSLREIMQKAFEPIYERTAA